MQKTLFKTCDSHIRKPYEGGGEKGEGGGGGTYQERGSKSLQCTCTYLQLQLDLHERRHVLAASTVLGVVLEVEEGGVEAVEQPVQHQLIQVVQVGLPCGRALLRTEIGQVLLREEDYKVKNIL